MSGGMAFSFLMAHGAASCLPSPVNIMILNGKLLDSESPFGHSFWPVVPGGPNGFTDAT
jgi:hypothetical protein